MPSRRRKRVRDSSIDSCEKGMPFHEKKRGLETVALIYVRKVVADKGVRVGW
jgi:hypothetical protein